MKRNIASWERVLRVAGGGALTVAGAYFAFTVDVLAAHALATAGVILGLDLVATGVIGFCPLYFMLGRGVSESTPKKRRT